MVLSLNAHYKPGTFFVFSIQHHKSCLLLSNIRFVFFSSFKSFFLLFNLFLFFLIFLQFAKNGFLRASVDWAHKYGSVYPLWLSFNWGVLQLSGPDTVKAILNTAGKGTKIHSTKNVKEKYVCTNVLQLNTIGNIQSPLYFCEDL